MDLAMDIALFYICAAWSTLCSFLLNIKAATEVHWKKMLEILRLVDGVCHFQFVFFNMSK